MARHKPAGVPYAAPPAAKLLPSWVPPPPSARISDADLETFLPPKPKRINRAATRSQLAKATEETKRFVRAGDWTHAHAMHFVALWALMHERIYGVAPVFDGNDVKRGIFRAAHVLGETFQGDKGALVEMIKWAWKREARTEKYRRDKGITDGGRIGLPFQFSARLVTDYKIARLRGHE